MDYQRFYIGNVSQQGEQFQIVDEIFCFLCIAFDFEGEDGTAAVREVFCVQCLLLWIVGYRRMMYFLNLRLALQIFYNFQCVLNVTLYAERQGLKSCRSRKELNGESVAPVSRRRIARTFVTNAAGPTAFVKLMPW